MRKRESEWMDVSKSTSPDETEIPASATKLKLVFDEPLKRTIQDSAVVGQFAYASGLDAPNGYIYQISHVLEISTSSLSIQRAARRAEMHEYPLLSDHFPVDDTLYVIIRNSPGYQEFKLRGKEQCEDERVISMRREWTGGWKVYGNSVDVQDYLFRCTPDWSKRKDEEEECRWMTRNGTLLARSGREDMTSNLCFEPGIERPILDLLIACWVTKLWSATVAAQRSNSQLYVYGS